MITAFQCCVGFCPTTKCIGHVYTYIPSFLNLPIPPIQVVKEHWAGFVFVFLRFPHLI